jgi:hypothetical protein
MISRIRKEVSQLHVRLVLLAMICGALSILATGQQNPTVAQSKPYVVEYYYKVKWGYADEFVTLFKKNHYPLLKKQVEMGRMLQVSAVAPRYHMTENGRWDYRVTIVFKNATVANDGFDEKALIQELYPDQATYQKEEQRRFEILEAHWDLPLKDVDLDVK